MYNIWGDLPQQKWLAVIADKVKEDGGPKIEIVGFNDEDEARTFCTTYDSYDYEWAVITGCICDSGSSTVYYEK